MEDQKKEIVRLRITKMSENNFLQNLKESMPRKEAAGGYGEKGGHDKL